MPVQINEVVVKTSVDPDPKDQDTGAGHPLPDQSKAFDEIILEEMILEILKNKNER